MHAVIDISNWNDVANSNFLPLIISLKRYIHPYLYDRNYRIHLHCIHSYLLGYARVKIARNPQKCPTLEINHGTFGGTKYYLIKPMYRYTTFTLPKFPKKVGIDF